MKQAVAAALVLCAMPATGFAQQVDCRDCNHVAPWFRGEGGFIGTVAGEAEAVTFVASCGNVSITGKVEAEGGTVAQLFNHRNGLACDRDDGSLEIADLEDGGWYWITDASNSAVGNLVSRDILNNKAVELTSAGPGVTMSVGRGAVFVKETSTGRVGILPNILPNAPAEPAAICGPRTNTAWPFAYDRQSASGCMLGGGRAKIRLVGPGSFGARAMITNGMVYRPTAGTITVTADLWLDESGSYSTATDNTAGTGPSAASIQKGWAGKTASATGAGLGNNWLTATFDASVAATVGAATTIPDDGSAAVAGVTQTEDGDTAVGDNPVGQAVFTIGPDPNYCSRTANHTALVNIAAQPGANAIHPPIAIGRAAGLGTSTLLANYSVIAQLRVVCAPR